MLENTNFWRKLSVPFSVLAPMDDVTDVVFREIITKVGAPDVFFTEFTNCDALASPGRKSHIQRLLFTQNQRPIVAQVWGKNLENLTAGAKTVKDLGFDGIDINMGCPVKDVVKIGQGSALIKDKQKALEIIKAIKEGAGDLPVSVKTRIGYDTIITEEWIGFLLEQKLGCITVHTRTAKEKSLVPARWSEITKVIEMRNKISPNTIIVGNGDVREHSQIKEYSSIYGCEGVMIGRGVFGNIRIFNHQTNEPLTKQEALSILKEHLTMYQNQYKGARNFARMRAFFKLYLKGFDGASELRAQLNVTEKYEEALKILDPNNIDF